jgi:ribosomal-protein-alanine N-acetyltransferase
MKSAIIKYEYAGKSNYGQASSMMLSPVKRDSQGLRFRRMTLADVPRVRQIDVLSFPLPWPEKSYIFELTENPSTLALVAETGESLSKSLIIGMSVVWIIVNEAHIATIAIHPDFRGNGYGKRLLAETIRLSIQQGAQLATLEVRASNQVAQQMYRSFGFTIVGRRSRYYHDNNEDAVLMSVDQLDQQYLTRLEQIVD